MDGLAGKHGSSQASADGSSAAGATKHISWKVPTCGTSTSMIHGCCSWSSSWNCCHYLENSGFSTTLFAVGRPFSSSCRKAWRYLPSDSRRVLLCRSTIDKHGRVFKKGYRHGHVSGTARSSHKNWFNPRIQCVERGPCSPPIMFPEKRVGDHFCASILICLKARTCWLVCHFYPIRTICSPPSWTQTIQVDSHFVMCHGRNDGNITAFYLSGFCGLFEP